METHVNKLGASAGKNVFNWRPAMENVLLDALELSIEDVLSRQQKQYEPVLG